MKISLLSLILLVGAPSFAATYSVPVEESLKNYAHFELEDFNIAEYEGAVTVKYKIPALLTGVDQVVEFGGKIDPKAETNILTGSNGVLNCTRELQEKYECKVQFKNLQFDHENAVLLINEASSSNSEFRSRLKVMKSFSSDPVGVLSY